ncbi:MAG: hypothetical protein JXM71_11340, partial [Spirochaetales bacterium]|nr:hypothetical protein [Spirochaetales bacterium]
MKLYDRTIRIAAAAAVVYWAASALACSGGIASNGYRAPDPAIVVAHSDGIVSRHAELSVVLSTGRDAAALEGVNPFTFEPAIDGVVSWSHDGTRVDFKPDEPLKPGKTYRAVFDFSTIGEPSNGWFSFKIRAAEPGFTVVPGPLYAAFDGSLSIDGTVHADEAPSTADV